MADAEHSKCFVRKGVWVQVPHPAPHHGVPEAFTLGAPRLGKSQLTTANPAQNGAAPAHPGRFAGASRSCLSGSLPLRQAGDSQHLSPYGHDEGRARAEVDGGRKIETADNRYESTTWSDPE
jgi:hypothetical protein